MFSVVASAFRTTNVEYCSRTNTFRRFCVWRGNSIVPSVLIPSKDEVFVDGWIRFIINHCTRNWLCVIFKLRKIWRTSLIQLLQRISNTLALSITTVFFTWLKFWQNPDLYWRIDCISPWTNGISKMFEYSGEFYFRRILLVECSQKHNNLHRYANMYANHSILTIYFNFFSFSVKCTVFANSRVWHRNNSLTSRNSLKCEHFLIIPLSTLIWWYLFGLKK